MKTNAFILTIVLLSLFMKLEAQNNKGNSTLPPWLVPTGNNINIDIPGWKPLYDLSNFPPGSIPIIPDPNAPEQKPNCGRGKQEEMPPKGEARDSNSSADKEIPNQNAGDPNEIIGTRGYDALGDTLQWVAATTSLPYTIYFENDPELATAAAQKVEVRLALHPKMDISTFAVGAFGFGSHVFTVEGTRSAYQQRLDLTQEMGLYVDVVAGIDIVSNEAFWIFQSIDPATLLPPQGTQEGFLPVNDESHSGEGYVSFTIKPKANACVTGDVITASASIVFDINEAIPTNVWHNTVDALPPTTQLTGEESYDNEVLLHFAGTDDEGGCGIKQYKLYVSDNYGAYSLYDTYPVGSEAAFPTEYDHCYRFFCLGEDNVGNVEAMKEAEVVIEAYPDGFPFFVAGYGESTNAGWKFIASPIAGSIAATTVDNIFAATQYDLYYFDQSEPLEWRNYKYEPFELVNGQGYLYATKEEQTLVFRGTYNDAETQEVPLVYMEDAPHSAMRGWNLIGNPFTMPAYANRSYYTMNEEGAAIEPVAVSEWVPIPACHGVMVKAEASGEMVTFSRAVPQNVPNQGSIHIDVAQVNSRGSVTHDKAIVSFNPNDQLDKFIFNESTCKVYIPRGGKDYAIFAYADKIGEIPLNFKATRNGEYAISVNPDGTEFNYLHLIDNLSGADVDLLALRQAQGPMSYTFEAKTTDYASRFRLVFSICGDANGDNGNDAPFAFISNGNIIIVGADAHAMLQVVDVMGRVLVSRKGDAMNVLATNGMAKGVYVLRLVNGKDVKTQKIVID